MPALVQQVDDLEAARVALGYDRIDLLSESAGTRTALILGWRYPESVHRSVMLGVNLPGNYLWDVEISDEQLARYAALCAEDPTCRDRTDDLVASALRATTDSLLSDRAEVAEMIAAGLNKVMNDALTRLRAPVGVARQAPAEPRLEPSYS